MDMCHIKVFQTKNALARNIKVGEFIYLLSSSLDDSASISLC